MNDVVTQELSDATEQGRGFSRIQKWSPPPNGPMLVPPKETAETIDGTPAVVFFVSSKDGLRFVDSFYGMMGLGSVRLVIRRMGMIALVGDRSLISMVGKSLFVFLSYIFMCTYMSWIRRWCANNRQENKTKKVVASFFFEWYS